MTSLRTALALVLVALAAPALAEYPDKPITIVVPFTAGGPTDKVARDLAEALRKPLGGQSVIVEHVARTIREVTRLRGDVEVVAAGSLPNDGKVIEDLRPPG